MKLSYGLVASVLALSLFSVSAHATLVDQWVLRKSVVKASELTRADGSKIAVPRSQEVALELWMESKRQYGSPARRLVKSAKVIEAGSQSTIAIDIENAVEQDCRARDEGGISLTMMGTHSAVTTVVAKPGTYALAINGLKTGTLVIGETGSAWTEETGYKAAVDEAFDREFVRVFGSLEEISFKGRECGVELGADKSGLVVNYRFEGKTEKLPNGDVLTRVPKEGSSPLRLFWLAARCGNKNQPSYEATFRGDADVELKLQVDEYGSRRTFEVGDKSCH